MKRVAGFASAYQRIIESLLSLTRSFIRIRSWILVRGECRNHVYMGYAEPMPKIM